MGRLCDLRCTGTRETRMLFVGILIVILAALAARAHTITDKSLITLMLHLSCCAQAFLSEYASTGFVEISGRAIRACLTRLDPERFPAMVR